MSGALLGGLVLVLVAGAALLVSATLGLRTAAETLLAAYVVAMTEVVGLVLLLSVFDALTQRALVAGSAAAFAAAAGGWLLAGAPRPPSPPREAVRELGRPRPLLVLVVASALAVIYVVGLIAATPPNGWDPLNYHLPRAAFWLQAEEVGYVDAVYDERVNFNPPNGEIAIAFALGVTRNEVFAAVVALAAALACSLGVYALARRFRLDRRAAAFGALLFLTLPIVLLQMPTAKNDVVVAAFLVAASVFVLGRSRREVALAALATALAVGTKFTAAYGLAVLLALALVAQPRSLRATRVVGLALGTLVGAYWYAVNAAETGEILGDQHNVAGLTAPLEPAENLLNGFGLLVDTLDLSGAEGADILFYVLAAAALAGGFAFTRSHPRDRAKDALLAASVLLSPLAMLALSTEVGRPAVVSLYDALGQPAGYLAEGDDVASSPTTASDTASWYGPAGLLLAIGVGVAAFVLVRRRSLPAAALVASAAPLAWLVLVAATLTYHPWEGRFFVYPLALSASLWGLGLRVPVVAWSAAALGVTTAFLSLVHYAEKPSGLRLFDRSPPASIWELARWEAQSLHDPAVAPVFRFLDESVPRDDSVALALSTNDFGYPAFGPHLDRRVELVRFGTGAVEVDADWLAASPERVPEIDRSCWNEVLASDGGSVFEREAGCVLPSSAG